MTKQTHRSPLDYVFAVGKIRALEKFLIRREVFVEAMGADLNDALKLFVESALYSDELLHVATGYQLEEVLNKELAAVKKIASDLILDKELLDIIDMDDLEKVQQASMTLKSEFLSDYCKYLIDMHNIKTFLRFFVLEEPIEKLQALLRYEGFIKKELFLKLYGQDLAVFIGRLEYVHKGPEIIRVINRACCPISITAVVSICDSSCLRNLL